MIRRSLRRLVLLGPAGAGKDTLATLVSECYGHRAASSSHVFMTNFARWIPVHATRHNAIEELPRWLADPHLPVRAFARRYWPFGDVERMYDERGAWRATWYALIARSLRADPGGLAREVFRGHEIYTGVRSRAELGAMRREHPHVRCYWVRRPGAHEGSASCEVTLSDAHRVVPNHGNLQDLEHWVQDNPSWFTKEGRSHQTRRSV